MKELSRYFHCCFKRSIFTLILRKYCKWQCITWGQCLHIPFLFSKCTFSPSSSTLPNCCGFIFSAHKHTCHLLLFCHEVDSHICHLYLSPWATPGAQIVATNFHRLKCLKWWHVSLSCFSGVFCMGDRKMIISMPLNPGLGREKQEDLCEMLARLIYRVNSKTAKAIYWDPVLKK